MNRLYLLAQVAGHGVAIESSAVESVVDLGDITPAPLAAQHILGLATLRSRVVTVVDTAGALADSPGPEVVRRAIVSVIEGHHYAFVVESLEDIAEFTARPLASGLALKGGWQRSARASIDRDGEPALVIDLSAIIPRLH